MHMKPNDSSILFKCFDFSRGYWGLNSLPMETLYKPLLHKTICISSLQSRQLKGVRILGVKFVELSILQFQGTTNYSKIFDLPTKTLQFEIKPIQTLSTSTCALSLGASHLARLPQIESGGSNAIIPGIMWNPIASGASMEVSRD